MRAYIIYIYTVLVAIVVTIVGCKSQKETATATLPTTAKPILRNTAALPKAKIYKTSGDFADRVPVTMGADGMEIVSFPDPSDLRGEVKPIALSNGYLLDRRGINPNTAFLDYTYDEYAALPEVPTVAELKRHILALHPIVELYALPITPSEAVADTARCNAYVASGFKGCKAMIEKKPTIRLAND